MFLPFISADCVVFYDPLDNQSTVTNNGGSLLSGSWSFVDGINDDAISFDGSSRVQYTDTIFDSESGTISLWINKSSFAGGGGIWEIGRLGGKSSLGFFYNNDNYVYFETRTDTGAALAWGNIILNKFNHIIATWDKRGDTYHTKLFINGEYVDGGSMPAPFNHSNGYLDLGYVGWYGNGNIAIDDLKFFNRQLSDPEIYAEYVIGSNRYRNQPTAKPVSTGPVKIINKTLYVNDKPFKVKGIGYQPVPIGSSNTRSTLDHIYSDPDILNRDLPLLKSMGVNTVRLWAQLDDDTLLDALEQHNMYALMTFEVPTHIDYGDPAVIADLENQMRTFVDKFKDHPAVLAWTIGNENNLPYTGTDPVEWYALANRLAKVAYEEEGTSYHPTMPINGYMLFMGDVDYCSDDVSMNYIDMWGHNSYTGYSFDCYFDYYDKISSKPLIITEYGVDAYNSSSGKELNKTQAEWEVHQWNEIKEGCAGGTLMAYSDEWWKSGSYSSHNTGGYYTDVQPDDYSNEEWYGIMAIEDNGTSADIMHPRQVYYDLGNEFLKDEFVKVNRTEFYLDNKIFHFAGTNGYFLWAGEWDCNETNPAVQGRCSKELLDDAAAMNFTVIRTWGFSDGYEYWGSLQPNPRTYDEASFQKFDRLIQEAGRRDLKLLIPLINNWPQFGGVCQYVRWCNITDANLCNPSAGTGNIGADVHDAFYTNSCTKDLYKDYIDYFLNRKNTLTGVKYKDDPTILGWELGNEPRAQSDPTGETLRDWIDEMSSYIKSIDTKHLVATGEDGFYVNGGRSEYGYNGEDGSDFIMNSLVPTIDYASFHIYDWEGLENSLYWVERHAQDARRIIQKPIVAGELGYNRASASFDDHMQGWYNKIEEGRINGDLLWMLCPTGFFEEEGRCVYYPEDDIVPFIINHSNYMYTLPEDPNHAPVLQPIENRTINAGDLLFITAYGSDSDNDTLYYSIDSSRFIVEGNNLSWQTSIYDTGIYNLRITADDSDLGDSQEFVVTIIGENYSCIPPEENMVLTESTEFCPGTYYLRGNININLPNIVLRCNETIMIGNNSAPAIVINNNNITIEKCGIENYTIGILNQYNHLNGKYIDNEVINCPKALYLDLAFNNTLLDNRFIDSEVEFHTSGYNNLSNNFISGEAICLRLHKTRYSYFFNNTISNCGSGVYLDESNNNRFDKNTIVDSTDGFSFSYSVDYTNFTNNIIINNNFGFRQSIYAYRPSYYLIIEKNIIRNNSVGMELARCYNFTIRKNTISSNNKGIDMLNSGDNIIYFNNFVDNNIYHAYSQYGLDSWDHNGFGNYWDDFDEVPEGCIDSDNDDICDSAYNLADAGVDSYPLTEQDWWIENYGETEILFNSGWNLMSLPIMLENSTPASIFTDVDYSILFGFNSTTKEWSSYVPDRPEFLNSLSYLSYREGYWIDSDSEQQLYIEGKKLQDTQIMLYTGSNLIGYPSVSNNDVSMVFRDINDSLDSVYGYDASDAGNEWKSYNPDLPSFLNTLTILRHGYGYWVNVNENVSLILE